MKDIKTALCFEVKYTFMVASTCDHQEGSNAIASEKEAYYYSLISSKKWAKYKNFLMQSNNSLNIIIWVLFLLK